jgi:hypothetical protein
MNKVYRSKYSEIFFYFPEESNLKLVPKKVLRMAAEDKVNELMGYSTDGVFLKNYGYQIGTNKKKVKQPTLKDFEKIKDIIFEFEDKFQKVLPKKNRGSRYFILPWYPNESESKKFDGSNATATYYRTVHIYIDITSYTKKGILKTLAHELNHLYFFDSRKSFSFSIRDMLIMEGLAEHFREYMVGGKVAPWSKALNDKQIISAIKKVEPFFESTKREDYENIFFGSKGFKRWTGYTLGYYLVKRFIKNNKNLSWEKIMKTDIKHFFE